MFSANDTTIEITKDHYIIDGDGHTIDAKSNIAIFKLKASNAVIKNINFKNGKTASNGGAIIITGDTNNILNCTFTNCSANNGGAICKSGIHDTIDNCTFINCSATTNGGAIEFNVYDGSMGNCTFINCFASQDGGAIHSNEMGDSFYKCNFINCSSNQNGGAICWLGNQGYFNTCNFTSCSADKGGAFYNAGTYIETITNCRFTKCNAATSGGAVYSTTTSDDCTVTNSKFIDNTAANGPAIYDESNNLKITSSAFIDETSTTLSDIIYQGIITDCNINESIRETPSKSTFANLTSLIGSTPVNGVLELDCDFENDGSSDGINITKRITIDGKGHTIDAKNKSRMFKITADGVILKNIIFKNGYASDYEGTIFINAANTNVQNCTFENCSSKSYGGAITYGGNNNTIEYSSFINCSSSRAGAISFYGTNYYLIKDCHFENCHAQQAGAVMRVSDHMSNPTLDIVNSDFIGCYAEGHTGAVYSPNKIANSTFRDCFANNTGAIHCDKINTLIEDSSFINCSSANGGAVKLKGVTNGNLNNCSFLDCNANENGGAVFCDCYDSNIEEFYPGTVYGCNNFTFRDSNFVNCSSANGGAIRLVGNNALINDCSFTNCSGEYGGAINVDEYNYNSGSETLKSVNDIITDCEFRDCFASKDGGSIYWKGDDGTVNNSAFNCSKADMNGGSIYWRGTNGKIEKSNFTLSKAKAGKAIYIEDGIDVTIASSSFEKNTADETDTIHGGTLSNCTFSGSNITSGNTTTSIEISPASMHILEEIPVTITVKNQNNDTITGNVEFYVNGVLNRTIVIGESFTFISALAGNYTLEARFNGDETYLESQANKTVQITKINPSIVINVEDIDYGETATVNITLPTSASGNVTVNVNGKEFIGVLNDGSASIQAMNLTTGTHTVEVNYSGDDRFQKGSNTTQLNVRAVESSAHVEDITLEYGNTLDVNVTTEGATGITAKIGDTQATVNGNTVTIPILDVGTYTLSVTTLPDENHNAVTVTANVTVNRIHPNITLEVHDMDYGETATVNVILPSDAGGDVTLNIYKGNEFVSNNTLTLINGKTSWKYDKLTPDIYSVTATYEGNSRYERAVKSAGFAVRPKVEIKQNVTVGDEGRITMDFAGNITDSIVIKIDGKSFAVADIEEGIVNCTFSTSKLTARNHTVTFAYEGNQFDANILNLIDGNTTKPVEYEMYLLPLEISVPEDLEPDNNNVYIINFTENATGTVEVFVNGEMVMIVEIVNGIAKIDLSDYKDGTYEITFVYSGNDIYDGFTKDVELKNAKITAKNTKVLYTAGQKYSVTVYDREGKAAGGVQVIFKIKNKQVGKANTNSNGVATYKVTNTPGTYKITATALAVSATKTLTVKHVVTLKTVTVKRSAKKLVLTATLSKVNKKYLKNKKVTFKFNGKKYTAKTNKKGVAKVTIKSSVLKKLKAGKKVTYQATYLKDTVKKTAKIKK